MALRAGWRAKGLSGADRCLVPHQTLKTWEHLRRMPSWLKRPFSGLGWLYHSFDNWLCDEQAVLILRQWIVTAWQDSSGEASLHTVLLVLAMCTKQLACGFLFQFFSFICSCIQVLRHHSIASPRNPSKKVGAVPQRTISPNHSHPTQLRLAGRRPENKFLGMLRVRFVVSYWGKRYGRQLTQATGGEKE